MPSVSSPYSTNPSFYSPYFIPVIVSLPILAEIVDESKIIVTSGIISKPHRTNLQWAFYISPYHQGSVTIHCLEGAFTDSEGRKSAQSNLLTLTVKYSTIHCVFVGPKATTELITDLSLVCEQFIPFAMTSLHCKECTIHSLQSIPEEDRVVIQIIPDAAVTEVTLSVIDSCIIFYKLDMEKEYTLHFSISSDVSPMVIPADSILSDSICSLKTESILISHTSTFCVTLTCPYATHSIAPTWLNATSVLYGTREEKTFKAFVFLPYNQNASISLNSGILFDKQGYIGSYTSLHLKAEVVQPTVLLTIVESDVAALTHYLRASFSKACNVSGITTGALQLEGTCVWYQTRVTANTNLFVTFSITVSSSCYLYATFKGGSVTMVGDEKTYNIASNTVKMEFDPQSFNFTSSIDSLQAVFTDEILFRLTTEGSVVSIHQTDLITDNCIIEQFVVGSISPNTIVEIKIKIQEEGEFSLQIPEGEVFNDAGYGNRLWLVNLKYVIEHGDPAITIRSPTNNYFTNKPLAVDIAFSLSVYELNTTCFETFNVNTVSIIDVNPYFVIHIFPSSQGEFSLSIKDSRCLLGIVIRLY